MAIMLAAVFRGAKIAHDGPRQGEARRRARRLAMRAPISTKMLGAKTATALAPT